MKYLMILLICLIASPSIGQTIQLSDLREGTIFLVKFNTGDSDLSARSIEDLDVIVEGFSVYPNLKIEVSGHSDFKGNPKANMKLSKERASIVEKYMISNGANKGLINVKAYGGSQPISRELSQINRRVEILIVENPDLGKNVFGAKYRSSNSNNYTAEQKKEIKTKPIDTTSIEMKKVALVIGNAEYTTSPKLKNPTNDAELMANTLQSLGFQVSAHINLNYIEMIQAIKEFSYGLNGSNVVVVYFAGHGMQFNGENYLLPTDAALRNGANDLPFEGVNSNTILKVLEYTNNESLNILILDACRSTPYNTGTRGSESGLAEIKPPTGTIIAYATSPGSVAYDGEGNNGVYTSQLAEQLNKVQRVEDVFMQTRLNVERITEGRQSPWELFRLRSIFYFKK